MKKNLMVVDDDASVRASLHKVLASAGYDVTVAANSEEAQRTFESRPIDLLILDLGLGTDSGWDTFERITTANPLLPVVVITGQTGQYDIALAAGAGALMEKPVDVNHLLDIIKELLAEPKELRLQRLCGYASNVKHEPPASTRLLRKLREQQAHEYPALSPAGGKRWGHGHD
jgi:DNA-binding NtrC family response regulator